MSAFNDFCIFCDKICTTHSIYCSEECRVKDKTTHYEFNNCPALISPNLQPRCDSVATSLSFCSSTALQSEETEDEEEYKHSEYMIKSPLLLTPTNKDQEKIAGLNLNDTTPRSASDVDGYEESSVEDHFPNLLATSSNNYKKWLKNHS